MISLYVLVFLSLCVNVLLVWYSRRLAKEYVAFVETLHSLEGDLIKFNAHLKSIYELDMFYGDSTLEGLIEHSKQVADKVTDFYDNYTLEKEEKEEEEPLLDGSS